MSGFVFCGHSVYAKICPVSPSLQVQNNYSVHRCQLSRTNMMSLDPCTPHNSTTVRVIRKIFRHRPCHHFLPGVLCVTHGYRTGLPTGMSHRAACGWSQVRIDSGPVAMYLLQWHMHARYWYSNSVCLSVLLSITCRYSVETAYHIVIVISPHGSPIILVLRVSNIFAKFRRGHPLQGC